MINLNKILAVLQLLGKVTTWSGKKSGVPLESVNTVGFGCRDFGIWCRAAFTEGGKARVLEGKWGLFRPAKEVTLDGEAVTADDFGISLKLAYLVVTFKFEKGGMKHRYDFTGTLALTREALGRRVAIPDVVPGTSVYDVGVEF